MTFPAVIRSVRTIDTPPTEPEGSVGGAHFSR
jgi:hypothetical protein